MLGSCYSWSSRRYGTITWRLVRNVTVTRHLWSSSAGCARRAHTGLPLFSRRRETVRRLTHSASAHEKPASPSLSTPQTSSLLDPSSPHSSLDSFHAYARRTGLAPTSTVYAGTTYEYLAQSTLRPYGFSLHRVGGRGDRGVDLVGIWEVPVLSHSGDWKEKKHTTGQGHHYAGTEDFEGVETLQLKVLVQCKRLVGRHARIGPNLVRELDGAVRATRSAALVNMVYTQNRTASMTAEDGNSGSCSEEEPRLSGLRSGPAIGVLVGTRPATKGVVDSMSRSTRGLVWVMMEEVTDQDMSPGEELPHASRDESAPPARRPHSAAGLKGRIKQILWNQAAREAGLEGVDVVKRYDSKGQEEVVLMRGGRVWGGGSRK
ncbi:uncharacterized protein PV07_10586 [Cladophialophora immunda]|uniref:Required for respiratory growth protein 7, mitochondrial n=1 Tax=Cladophialophora immunda TaxID=569365 RepID=A0A0D2C0R1_9EURO|nr:uncharacterized protein PV07_10586 [Cladophialophora immunda]KIW24903.1 hypothetical protein PV07_10586 [Cladophialophora immunda]